MSREPAMRLSMIAIIGIPRTMPLFVGIVLALASCAQQGANLPEFPHYRPADDFLEMQEGLVSFTRSRPQPDAHGKRNEEISRDLRRQLRLSNAKSLELRARQREEALLQRRITSQRDFLEMQQSLVSFTRSRPQPDAHGKRNEEISRDLERQLRLSNAKSLELRARQREEALLRRRIASQRDFAGLQAYLARSAALQAEIARGEERESRVGFERVQDRLARLRRAREEALVRRRIASHDEWAALQEQLARSEALLAEKARSEERQSRRGFERHQDRMLRLRRAREEALVRHRLASQRDFAALQAQLARSEALQAEVARGEEREFRRGFERVQDRLLGRQRAE